MPRVLLLLPTTSYRTADFMEAARQMGLDVVIGSELPQVLEAKTSGKTLTLNFRSTEQATRDIVKFSDRFPFDAIIPVDDDTSIVGALASKALGLPHNSVESVLAARDKYRFRQVLKKAGIPSPRFELFSITENPLKIANEITYPCVLKPTFLSASRGVIRANNPVDFVEAFIRVKEILKGEDISPRGYDPATQILVEDFLPGTEVALEGILTQGRLRVLALFDKPDPLDGPYFEETIYVTPSRLPKSTRDLIFDCANRTFSALGLRYGPVHTEFRINDDGIWPIEAAARSIGGLCSRALQFGTGKSLEELILLNALESDELTHERESSAAGVMMLPIPNAGVLKEVRGQSEALAVEGIEELVVLIPQGQEIIPLPEGTRYLGFLFSRADTPAAAEVALRKAYRKLDVQVRPI